MTPLHRFEVARFNGFLAHARTFGDSPEAVRLAEHGGVFRWSPTHVILESRGGSARHEGFAHIRARVIHRDMKGGRASLHLRVRIAAKAE